jgi:hypothetical protein
MVEVMPDRAQIANGNGRGESRLRTRLTVDGRTRSRRGYGKALLLTRSHVDGRTRARKAFESVARNLTADLGGEENLTTVQRYLIHAFAGCVITLDDLNNRALAGQDVDLFAYSQTVSTLTRVASRLGTKRIAKEVGPSLIDLLREDRERHAD